MVLDYRGRTLALVIRGLHESRFGGLPLLDTGTKSIANWSVAWVAVDPLEKSDGKLHYA